MWTANALRQLYVTYCKVKIFIAEFKLSSKLKNHEIPGHKFTQTPFFVSMIKKITLEVFLRILDVSCISQHLQTMEAGLCGITKLTETLGG
jgi:hypothetical protein